MAFRRFAGVFAGLALVTPFAIAAAPTCDVAAGRRAEKMKGQKLDNLCRAYNARFREGNYLEAERLALIASELDPDHGIAAGSGPFLRRRPRSAAADKNSAEASGSSIGSSNDAEKRIEKRLRAAVSISFEEMPLIDAINNLRDLSGINIHLDRLSMQAEGIDLNSPITIKLEQVSLKSALNLILHDVHLGWRIKNEILEITTEDEARGKPVAVTSSVADILSHKPVVVHVEASVDYGPPVSKDEEFHITTEEELIKLIFDTVEPRSWVARHGPGTIDYDSKTRSLVITASPEIQEQIADLLATVRRLQEGQAR